tara:strand:- start:37179 stop:37307 length:129 start_codon:yes stop_codon:yes gene_type:complete
MQEVSGSIPLGSTIFSNERSSHELLSSILLMQSGFAATGHYF